MKIFLACPAPAGSQKGNRVTGERWAELLKSLGHRLLVGERYANQDCDAFIAVHARRSYDAIRSYRRRHPKGPLVVALAGTDLYRDIRTNRKAKQSLDLADRLVVLQPSGLDEVPPFFRDKTRVIYQSAAPSGTQPKKSEQTFDVCVLAHLREEKDPLRAAMALRWLPETSRVRVLHAGKALTSVWARRARAAAKRDTRYSWLGELPRAKARQLLARCLLLVLSSRMEGGANVLSEALAEGVPILASHIPGCVGLLGEDYPGLFPAGDSQALARL